MQHGTISNYNKEVKHSENRATPLKIISQLFDYYKGREYSLVQLLYKFGATNPEIGKALGIDPSLVSRNYPRGVSK